MIPLNHALPGKERSILSRVNKSPVDIHNDPVKEFEDGLVTAGLALYLGRACNIETPWRDIVEETRQQFTDGNRQKIGDALKNMTERKLERICGSLIDSYRF